MASLTLKNVKKIYPYSSDDAKKKKKKGEPEKKTNLQITDKGVVAVQEFNLEIADKEFIVLVGPSGCGKSTTLRMIAGLEEISEGELYIGDRLVNDVAPKDRDIAMVFQNYALYPHMTVYENMAFALKLRHTPKDEIDKAVKQAAEILDITQYLGRKPKALSGGQRQRVAIGRAIVRSPQVMLMDEPLSNLDATPQMNMFENAKLVKVNGKYAVKLDNLTVELSEDKQAALAKNNVAEQDVVLGVRPEHIELGSGIEGRVDVHEMMGSSVHLHVTSMGRDVVMVVSTMNMSPAEVAALANGSTVKFNFPGHVCHVFSKETGINLEA